MSRHEVVVLGAGPAGCAAATLLARRAHDVAVVRPRQTPDGALAESIPPSTRKVLDELGLLDALDHAGLNANEGNAVWWAERPLRTEIFTDGPGIHARRERLEEVLVAAAQAAGVRVYDDATAREVTEAEPWTVRCEAGDGSTFHVSADWLVDATGRRGVMARREGRVVDRDTTTLALVQSWRRRESAEPPTDLRVPSGDTLTLIESHEHGWLWSIPVDAGTRVVTAMVDPRRTPIESTDIGAALRRELGAATHLRASLDGWVPAGEAWACPASLHHGRRFAREGLFLVGDAASAIDPLSSYGVKKALSSGWLAGVATHTALVDSTMRVTAVEFFDARERALYRESRRASAAFFAEAHAVYGSAFWEDRARAAATASTEPDAAVARPIAEVPEAAVRAAFEAMRARPSLDAALGPTLERFERPTVRGQRIVMAVHLASAAYPGGLRWVCGVDLARLMDVATRHADVPDTWDAYNAVAAPVALPDYLTALSTAFAAGFLVHRET